jgi:tRNA(fMet)-specific endonuclease VapC
MIKAMLDTNILIYIYKNHPPAVVEQLKKFRRGEIVVSSIVWAEFSVGLHKLKVDGRQIGQLIDVLPFDHVAGDVFGRLSAKYPDRAQGFDRLIAAHAIAVGVKLVTNNTADFAPYLNDGLAVENWA